MLRAEPDTPTFDITSNPITLQAGCFKHNITTDAASASHETGGQSIRLELVQYGTISFVAKEMQNEADGPLPL